MTTLDALRRAICAAPEEDLPRLVMADWLDERNEPGDAERAEFVRCQIRLACPYQTCSVWCSYKHGHQWPCEVGLIEELRTRERELFNEFGREWFGDYALWLSSDRWEQATPHALGLVVARGFVHTVRAPLSVLIGRACERCGGTGHRMDSGGERTIPYCPACSGTGRTVGVLPGILQREPCVKVVATDKEPEHYTDSHTPYGWRMWNPSQTPTQFDIPEDIWHLIQGVKSSRPRSELTGYGWVVSFAIPDLAHSALSAALLAWGKSA